MTESISALVRFLNDVQDHQLEVAHDDGAYRHLRFRKPGTGMYWFDILTSPRVLTINGDMGTWTFSRTEDMLSFFRGDRINASYWQEKLLAGRDDAERHDEDVVKRVVLDYLDEAVHPEWGHLDQPVVDRILTELDDDAMDGKFSEVNATIDALREAHPTFHDAYEWSFKDYSTQYLWCLHAIRWAIDRYDEHVGATRAQPFVAKGAIISDDGLYRYELTRRWAHGPRMVFLMLNPSTADATEDDRTIGRCVEFAKAHGFAGIKVVNLYAYRTKSPKVLWAAAKEGVDIVGPDNGTHLRRIAFDARNYGEPVVAAWGAGADPARVAEVLGKDGLSEVLYALEVTKDGRPKHPLYIKGGTTISPYARTHITARWDTAVSDANERIATQAAERADEARSAVLGRPVTTITSPYLTV